MNKFILIPIGIFIIAYIGTNLYYEGNINLFMALVPAFWISFLIYILLAIVILIYITLKAITTSLFTLTTRGKLPLDADIDDINKKHGTEFSSNKLAMGSTLGTKLFFDNTNKKLCIYGASKTPDVVNYDYIKSWRSEYKEISKGRNISQKDIFIILETSDIDRPLLHIPLPSKAASDAWISRLNIMLGN